jgi:DNA-binding response OmpR family regulator
MFVNKPVRFDQVYHAIQSIWRRFAEPRARSNHWVISNDSAMLVSPLGQGVSLTPAEAVSRAELADAAGIVSSPDHRNLDAAVFRLRRKIEREANSPSPFRTVHGIGYQLSEAIDAALTDNDQ